MLRLPHILRLPTKLRRRARRARMTTLLILLLLIPTLLLLPFYVIYRPPRLLISYLSHRWPDVLWQVLPSSSTSRIATERLIALTIDDAPSEFTPKILQLLQENDAHATLFVIGGQVSGREAALHDLVAAGMELGNHAMHDEAARGLPLAELETQIQKTQGMIDAAYESQSVADKKTERHRYFRPGSGLFSTEMRAMVTRMGYRMVLGSVYPHDAQLGYWWLNSWHILSSVRPGAIIVCHDRRSWTVPMLKKVLPELKRRGYKVVTVSDLLEAAI